MGLGACAYYGEREARSLLTSAGVASLKRGSPEPESSKSLNEFRLFILPMLMLPFLIACHQESQTNSSEEHSPHHQSTTNASESEELGMGLEERPWEQAGRKVYWPSESGGLEFSWTDDKLVDPATAEFLVMHPPNRGENGRFVYGRSGKWIVSGAYQVHWNPSASVRSVFILSLDVNATGKDDVPNPLSFDLSPVARLMRGRSDAAKADTRNEFTHLFPERVAVIDARANSNL